jgi:hypothetical protein
MRGLKVLAFVAVGALAYLMLPQAGGIIPSDVCTRVSGGCTVTSFSACANAVLTEEDPCAKCSGHIDCDSSHTSEACSPLYNTAAADCISCGTCNEHCGGNSRYWSQTGCKGTFTTSTCVKDWKDAQNSTCSVACPAE